MKSYILNNISSIKNGFSVCGMVDKKGRVYPLGTDSKVISTVFEMITRGSVIEYAKLKKLKVQEAQPQNYYPDFTLMKDNADKNKVAIDVKTSYRISTHSKFSYTLGSYTSYIRQKTPGKNIAYPFGHYKEHWVVGFVYERVTKIHDVNVYSIEDLQSIQLPFQNVDVFMQEKWRIASDKAGSGNTTNIGSIKGTLEDFKAGNGIFDSEGEFLAYWRNYARTPAEREKSYADIKGFRKSVKFSKR